MSAPSSSSAPGEEKRADLAPAQDEQEATSVEKHDTGTELEARDDKDQDTASQKEEETQLERDETEEVEEGEDTSAPPLPDEVPPPLPDEAPPGQAEDDGWEPVWDAKNGAYYFYNRFTGVSQWENPRVPDTGAQDGADSSAIGEAPRKKSSVVGSYNPAIHGDYDPTAPYAQQYEEQSQDTHAPATDPSAAYAATGIFNRFTGRWQAASINPENYNDENKTRRQMNAFFDVDAAANSHDGRSLRAERSAKKLSKKELKTFKEKRREKKEEKRRAWLRD